ncbi:hypothetical protein LAJ19_17485 (plasmid) [Deinococcus taeanensis]|uniref:hypothetical protein n=1 Tax=Deinococcus taeanensis TaxID=2737050 RepID=UPI001CDD57F6|nr:hypothetical protein [Deinococcus taeanensis]UBV44568.1 hypothetical protein LAJ19_17485 [Deinococcus taeanensis]
MTRTVPASPRPRPQFPLIIAFIVLVHAGVIVVSIIYQTPLPFGIFMSFVLADVICLALHYVPARSLPGFIRALGSAFRGINGSGNP